MNPKWAPRLKVLHRESGPSEQLALKPHGTRVQESQKATENGDFSLKGHVQNLTFSQSKHGGSSLKEA